MRTSVRSGQSHVIPEDRYIVLHHFRDDNADRRYRAIAESYLIADFEQFCMCIHVTTPWGSEKMRLKIFRVGRR